MSSPTTSAAAVAGNRRVRAGGAAGARKRASARASAGAGAATATVAADVVPVGATCSAWANCAAVANRSAAIGASARRIAWSTGSGTLGRTDRTLGGGSVRRFTIIACAVAPVNGASPASISYSTAPRL